MECKDVVNMTNIEAVLWSDRWTRVANLNLFVAELEVNDMNLELT